MTTTLNSKKIAELYIRALTTESYDDQKSFLDYMVPVWNWDADDAFCDWAVNVTTAEWLSRAFDIGMSRNN
jgi:hypothetical protein